VSLTSVRPPYDPQLTSNIHDRPSLPPNPTIPNPLSDLLTLHNLQLFHLTQPQPSIIHRINPIKLLQTCLGTRPIIPNDPSAVYRIVQPTESGFNLIEEDIDEMWV